MIIDRLFSLLTKSRYCCLYTSSVKKTNTFHKTIPFSWYKTVVTSIFDNFMFKITSITILASINFVKLLSVNFINIIKNSILCIISFINSVNISFIISNISESNMSLSDLIANFQTTNHFDITTIV